MSSYSNTINSNANNNPSNNPSSNNYQFQQLKEDLIFDPHQMLMSIPQQRFYNPTLLQPQNQAGQGSIPQQQQPSQNSQPQPQPQPQQQQQQQQPYLMNVPQTYTQSQPQQLMYSMPPLQAQQQGGGAGNTNGSMPPPPPHHSYQQQSPQQQQQLLQMQQSQTNNNSQFYDSTIPNYLIMGQGSVMPNQTTNQPNISYYNYAPPIPPPNVQQQQPLQSIPPQKTQTIPQQQSLPPPPQRTVRSKLQTSLNSGKGRSRSSVASNKGTKKQSSSPSSIPNGGPPLNSVIYPNFPERMQQILPPPPLSRAPVRPDMSINLTSKRAKRKSKFTPEQDDLIVGLKKKGKSWVEIAEITGVGSYLAARNRYQVIVGQQGNNNSSAWDNKDKLFLHQLLDAAELEKWRFICLELNKSTNKNFTDYECREMIRELFFKNPVSFGVNEETIAEAQREKKLTEKIIDQREQSRKKRSNNQQQHQHQHQHQHQASLPFQVDAKYIDPQYRNYQTSQFMSNNTSATNSNTSGGITITPPQQQQHHTNQDPALPPPPQPIPPSSTTSLSMQQQIYNKQYY